MRHYTRHPEFRQVHRFAGCGKGLQTHERATNYSLSRRGRL